MRGRAATPTQSPRQRRGSPGPARAARASWVSHPPPGCRPQSRAATPARSRAQLTSAGHRPGQLDSLQRPRPCPPPARPLHCAASRAAAFAPTWPACPPSPGHCAHVRGRGHNPARIPPPGKGARRAARSQSAREPARRGDTPPARARTARAPSPRARALAPQTLLGGTQWALNKCWSDSSHTCALEPDRVMTHLPSPHP